MSVTGIYLCSGSPDHSVVSPSFRRGEEAFSFIAEALAVPAVSVDPPGNEILPELRAPPSVRQSWLIPPLPAVGS